MTPTAKAKQVRRRLRQRRARETVEAVLDAVIRILKRHGVRAITTNRIAEVAGVSIGSVYQYFPNKDSIFNALHQRHIDQVDRLIQRTLVEHASSPLEDLMRGMIEAMIEAHATDPELYQLLLAEVPHHADGTKGFAERLHGAFLLAISCRAHELKKRRNLETVAYTVVQMVEALSHGAVLRRPPALSLEDAKEEAVKAVLAYLRA